MSVVTVSVATAVAVPGVGLFPLLVVAGIAMAASGALGHYANSASRAELERRAEGEIERVRGKIEALGNAGGANRLAKELDEIQKSATNGIKDADSSRPIFEALRELSMKASRLGIDEEQFRNRVESAGKIASEIKTLGSFSDYEQLERIKLERLEAELGQIRISQAENRMAELQRVMDELIEVKLSRENKKLGLEKTADRAAPHGSQKEAIGAQERSRLVNAIRDLAGRIAGLDEAEGERLAPTIEKLNSATEFPERLASLERQLKTTWGAIRERASTSAYFRDILFGLRAELDKAREADASGVSAKLIVRCDTLCGGKFVERADFMKLYEDIARFAIAHTEAATDSFFAGKVKEALEELGYELIEDEDPGAVHYLETPYEGYHVMAKIDKDCELTARLVRDSDGEKSAQDREIGEKWCSDFDAFLGKMKDSGLPLDVRLRREPGEAEVIAAPKKLARSKRKARKGSKKQESEELRALAREDDGK